MGIYSKWYTKTYEHSGDWGIYGSATISGSLQYRFEYISSTHIVLEILPGSADLSALWNPGVGSGFENGICVGYSINPFEQPTYDDHYAGPGYHSGHAEEDLVLGFNSNYNNIIIGFRFNDGIRNNYNVFYGSASTKRIDLYPDSSGNFYCYPFRGTTRFYDDDDTCDTYWHYAIISGLSGNITEIFSNLDYFPLAVNQNNTWKSCDRSGGRCRIYKNGGWVNMKNSFFYNDTSHNKVRIYNDGWKKSALIGSTN